MGAGLHENRSIRDGKLSASGPRRAGDAARDEVPRITPGQHACVLLFVTAGAAVALSDYRAHERADLGAEPLGAEDALSQPAIPPIPLEVKLDARKVHLGERLYHDARLSHDDSISCATCHDLRRGGTDQLPASRGIGGAVGGVNSPTTFNSGFFFSQFWNGRARDLVEQASGPVHNPKEMGSAWPEVVAKLSRDASYVRAFAAVYGDGLSGENVADALAEYERSLNTPGSRFDRYLRGATRWR
jgi:cytochrome c peroxidase